MQPITANITTPGEFREENPYKDDLCKTDENISFNCLISEDCPCERFGKFAANHPVLPALDSSNNPLPKGWCGKVELVYLGDYGNNKIVDIPKEVYDDFMAGENTGYMLREVSRIYRSIETVEAVKEVDMTIVNKVRTQVDEGQDLVYPYLKDVYDKIGGGKFSVDIRDYKNSNDRLTILKVDDKTIVSVIETRTEFNHVEYVFAQWQAQQDREGWIDVNERLPNAGEKVIVYFGRINNQLIARTCLDKQDKILFTVFYMDSATTNHAEDITHWQPLPAPPQQALTPKDKL